MGNEKAWRKRTQISIGELEDLWINNDKLEIARSYIYGIRHLDLSPEDKVGFIGEVLRFKNCYSERETGHYLLRPALEIFFELVPVWEENFFECCKQVIIWLSIKGIAEYTEGLDGKIKRFLNSYLNKKKGKEKKLNEECVAKALVNCRMFEELINYNFVSDRAIEELWNFLFSTTDEKYGYLFSSHHLGSTGQEKVKKRELLLSWDKVGNRHALATLHTLLAKRGDLQKIFEIE